MRSELESLISPCFNIKSVLFLLILRFLDIHKWHFPLQKDMHGDLSHLCVYPSVPLLGYWLIITGSNPYFKTSLIHHMQSILNYSSNQFLKVSPSQPSKTVDTQPSHFSLFLCWGTSMSPSNSPMISSVSVERACVTHVSHTSSEILTPASDMAVFQFKAKTLKSLYFSPPFLSHSLCLIHNKHIYKRELMNRDFIYLHNMPFTTMCLCLCICGMCFHWR